MKFGLFGGGKVGKLNPLGDSYGYRDFIRYIKDAEAIGFESAFMVEHHFTGIGQLSSSLNLLCYLAAQTSKIRLGTAVVVLPWHNPVLLAEQICTLDVLSEGRYEMGVGRGYRKNEFDAFCVPMADAQGIYEENLQLLLKCLTSKERFSWHSKHWNFENIVVEPGVVQQPHPPIWMAAGTPGGIAYVASQGYSALMDQIASTDEIIERVRIFTDAQEKAGLKRDASRCGVTRALHIINSEEERRQAYARRRETLKNIGELAKKPGGFNPGSMDDSDIANDDAALIGTPPEIVERLQRLADGGVEHVLFSNATASRESLMVFADKIMPHIKSPAKPAAKAA